MIVSAMRPSIAPGPLVPFNCEKDVLEKLFRPEDPAEGTRAELGV